MAWLVQLPSIMRTRIHAIALWLCACAVSGGCATGASTRIATPEGESHRSFVVPAVEIVAFEAALNAVARRMYDDGSFAVTSGTIRSNLRSQWVVDDDAFEVNQFLHPYQGATYHTIARSSGR